MRRQVFCAFVLASLVPTTVGSARPSPAPGVTDDAIKIGIHAPTTGAVPLPNPSIDQAADIYWRWLEFKGRKINGREVEVVLRNDNSNPTQATKECREMIRDDEVFMLSGMLQPQVVGSYQAQACARLADEKGVPYVSLGHSKEHMAFDSYLATSETIHAQARSLAGVFVDDLAAKKSKNAIVFINSAFYTEAAEVFGRALERRDATLDASKGTPKTAGATEAQAVVTELSLLEIDNVLLVVRPTFAIQILEAAENHGYYPSWATMGYTSLLSDETLEAFCNGPSGWDGMLASSPVPAFADRSAFDPTYDLAMQAIYPDANGGDMTTWLGWATSKQIHRLLGDAGRGLTRKGFIHSAEAGERYATGIVPPFMFSERDHFGGRKSYLLRASCDEARWSTLRRI